MKDQQHSIINGNQAVAHVAYRINDVFPIYPITPASEMSELVEEWSAHQQKNIFGNVPTAFEMQSEAGVAGAMHGALQTGSLSTTFTASQGLLLMVPNMYKIAGELTPNVIHVATRSVATHALSVFGDHSDVMAVRNTGYALLASNSVQEAMDFALISQAATLASRIPFVHFFDGFRTSHEVSKIEKLTDQVIHAMIDEKMVNAHRYRALDPNNPIIRGTSQGADVFFQSREAVNSYYDACPKIVQQKMNEFAQLTGRQYQIFEYVGHPEAEQVLIAMASATETVEETIEQLNASGEKIGLVKVRLFRPFSADYFINSIPQTCKSIAVLDRTKEPGSSGEPLYLDVVQAIAQSNRYDVLPKIAGGRYGLSSKEFTPAMVKAIVDNLKKQEPKNNFTVGITDDVTHLSLPVDGFTIQTKFEQAIFYQTKTEKTQKEFSSLLQLLGATTQNYVQGYSECDYRKSNSRSVGHLRLSKNPIKAPYLIQDADFVACDDMAFVEQDSVLDKVKNSGTIVVQTELEPRLFWQGLSLKSQKIIQDKNLVLFIVNSEIASNYYKVNGNVISGLHACYVALNNEILQGSMTEDMIKHISKVDTAAKESSVEHGLLQDESFSKTLLGKLLAGKGNELPVSTLPVDGTYATDTSKYNSRKTAVELPEWKMDLCTQCGACSMACPSGALRIKAFGDSVKANAPSDFQSVPFLEALEGFDLLHYTIQVNPDQCTSCNNCVDACPAKALMMTKSASRIEQKREHWNYFENIPEFDRRKIDTTKVGQQQLQEPLFKYPMGEDGCGQATYLKLLSQLFGDRMLVANATGASSIFGGALPTTPWSKNEWGRGPAWSNSLFEDNAEFGLGFRLSLNQQENQAKNLLTQLAYQLDQDLVHAILEAQQTTEAEINQQRNRIEQLKIQLKGVVSEEAKKLLNIVESLVQKSVWIVGGDGWAYDIGYGGLDHVLASGENVNILVLDNEAYSNTGGQMSKATPYGASARFAAKGKKKQKKDLGLLAMNYADVYVASVAIGADQQQTLNAFIEAEKHQGPSIIIAYCHSPSHGIDMKNPSKHHKAVVASGQWLLYRHDPKLIEEGRLPLQLDSKAPKIPIEAYLRMEKRFDNLFESASDLFGELMKHAQDYVDRRYDRYRSLAEPIPLELSLN